MSQARGRPPRRPARGSDRAPRRLRPPVPETARPAFQEEAGTLRQRLRPRPPHGPEPLPRSLRTLGPGLLGPGAGAPAPVAARSCQWRRMSREEPARRPGPQAEPRRGRSFFVGSYLLVPSRRSPLVGLSERKPRRIAVL